MKGNKTLYFFEGIACLLVVLIHDPFPGNLGIFFISIARCAVPLFFMVSGYSLYGYIETDKYKDKLKSRLKRNSRVLAIAIACYFMLDIVKCTLRGKLVLQFFAEMITISNVLRLCCLGVFPDQCSCGILWFILGQLYIYIFALLFANLTKKSTLPVVTIISFFALILANCLKVLSTALQWKIGIFDLSLSWIYGNWILIGLPCFFLGIGLADYIEKNHQKVKTVPIFWYLVIVAICIVLNYFLCLILDHQLNMYLSYTAFTLIIDYCIFFISQQDHILDNNPLAKIGCFHSRNIYISHPAIISCFNILFGKLNLPNWGGYIKPVLVIITTLVFSMVLNVIGRQISVIRARSAQ